MASSVAGISIAVAVFIGFALSGGASWAWGKYHSHREDLAPLLTLAAGVAVAGVAVAGVAVAGVALLRHFAQTNADRQRRITESYGKAVEQLAHDKIEVRLGGIYTLERISRESRGDYWTVMETLCAFVRERTKRKPPEEPSLETDFYDGVVDNRTNVSTDIAAVLTVIVRRDKKNQRRENDNGWRLDFRDADLRGANLRRANLRRANLIGANFSEAYLFGADLSEADLRNAGLCNAGLCNADLSEADLSEADLSEADLRNADLRNADLRNADLIRADLGGATLITADLRWASLCRADFSEANLRNADLREANLREANLREADLGGANLREADLGKADLRGADLSKVKLGGANVCEAERILGEQLAEATGDASTQLPVDLSRPAHWTAVKP